MKLSKFKFNLPQELIALHPAKNRDESRLMIVNRKTGEIEHKVFKDLLSYFGEKDVFLSLIHIYLRIDSFERQEHDAEVGGGGGSQILVGNILCHLFNSCFQ